MRPSIVHENHMTKSFDAALQYAERWLDIIENKNVFTEDEAKGIIDESKENFAEHFNRGWLHAQVGDEEAAAVATGVGCECVVP